MKSKPGHLVEMNSTKFIAKKSAVEFGRDDKSLLPIQYEGNAISSRENAILNDSENASKSDVHRAGVRQGLAF